MAKGEEGAQRGWTLPRSHNTASHKIDCLALVSTMEQGFAEKKKTVLKYDLHPRHVYDDIIRHAEP